MPCFLAAQAKPCRALAPVLVIAVLLTASSAASNQPAGAERGSAAARPPTKVYGELLQQQWALLRYPLPRPDPRFVPDAGTQLWLRADYPARARNRLLNRRYIELGERLARCLDHGTLSPEPIANWYTFAAWGSRSSGEIISGNRFGLPTPASQAHHRLIQQRSLARGRITEEIGEDLARLDGSFDRVRRMLNRWQLTRLSPLNSYVRMQQTIFAETNYQIGAEMIPLGESFLAVFCDRTASPAPFDELFANGSVLGRAFALYLEARDEEDLERKLELILLASVLQVHHEQERVQPNLAAAMILAPRYLTWISGFGFGRQRIPFHHDIRVVSLSPMLRTVELPGAVELYRAIGLEVEVLGATYQRSACGNWGDLGCRQRFLAQLFRELLVGEPELHELHE